MKKTKYDPNFEMIIPVIVFEGDMFEYYTKPKLFLEGLERNIKEQREEFPIKRIQHVPFLSNGIPEDPASIIIDVVTLDYFPNYIELIKKEFEKLPGRK